MNLKITLSVLLMMISFNLTYASFPVKKASATTEITETSTDADVLTSPAIMAGEKSQGVAMLLLLFAGIVAAHRWYLGKPWYINILYIITLGGLGIWALIDFIRILTGSMQPDNGSYKSDFF